jgi:protein-ribulosamine 3-kinase
LEKRQSILSHLSGIFNTAIADINLTGVSGGSINEAFQVTIENKGKFFIKLNSVSSFPGLFEKEKQGLEYLGKQAVIRVPEVIAAEVVGDTQVLVLEWVHQGEINNAFWKKFGEKLAALHKVSNDKHGFFTDNYMGALVQENVFTTDWIKFFINYRIIPQLRIATDKKLLSGKEVTMIENCFPLLESIFSKEPPSLLHGDLWNGNFICDEHGEPVLIDPAVYYGHRSMDLGMTKLFGGFDKQFYDSYNHHYPLPPNYEEQCMAANLYPLLIHLNLFGKAYLPQIIEIIKRLN